MRVLALALLLVTLLISGCVNHPTGNIGRDIMNDNRHAVFTTNHGEFTVELYEDRAPETTENFIKLAEDGFYDNTKFHRVIEDFMIQGGDPLTKDDDKKHLWGTGGPGYEIDDEFHPELRHDTKGILSMANSGPNTGGSQFFITVRKTPWLDGKHAVFGKIVEGYDVVEAVSELDTDARDRPKEPVVVESVEITS